MLLPDPSGLKLRSDSPAADLAVERGSSDGTSLGFLVSMGENYVRHIRIE